ncbi:MAG: sugar phosphate isomerase/epimerase [Isosphaeraceae bacterium]
MATRIGIDHYTISHLDLSAASTLKFARSHGFDGVQFLDPASIDRTSDPRRLAAFRSEADRQNLYIEVGISSPNPVRRSRSEGRFVSAAEHAADLEAEIGAVAALGCRYARAFVGDRHDRFRADTRWPEQIAATLDVLERLTPCLRDHRIRVALETHADLTVDELLGMLDQFDPEVLGVTLDTGNLPMRLEDPVNAVERLATRVIATHVKDCVLANTPRGLCWQARAVGSGILPMPELLARLLRANPDLNLTIELHPRIYDLPINDASWLAFFPRLHAESLSSVMRMAALSEARFQSGGLERPDMVEETGWTSRVLPWLALSLGYLRKVAPALTRLDRTSVPGKSPV